MPRLLDRNRQIPYGLKFHEPATKWEPIPGSSFETIVTGLIAHRRGNPYLAKKNNWAMTRPAVDEEVDAYNAAICAAHGWTNFISEGDGLPKSTAPHHFLESARNVAGGARALADWIGEGGVPVPPAEAEARAGICATCPKNGKGSWTRFFTEPAANVIRRQMAIRNDMALSTSFDDQLGVCTACDCPLTLKVHVGMKHILAHTSPEGKAQLDPRCWILKAQ